MDMGIVVSRIWGRMKGWKESHANQYLRAYMAESPGGGDVMVAHECYFRVWLSDLFLDKDVEWFSKHYPAVHASVQLKFANRDGVTFTSVIRPPDGMLGPGVRTAYPLTNLLPFTGGTVELEAGLMAIEGPSVVGAAIDILQDFSSLVAPPLSEALVVVNKLSAGVEKLLDATADDVYLGLHEGFSAAGATAEVNPLRSGFITVVLATPQQLDQASLSIINGRLHRTDRTGTSPLVGFNYMVLRVEGRSERDDWRFPEIEGLMNKAIDSVGRDDATTFEAMKRAAIGLALQSPDLIRPDRQRVALAIKDELDAAWTLGKGAVGEERRDLAAIVADRAISQEEARSRGRLTLADLVNG